MTAYDSEIRSANNQRKVVENDIETIELFESDQKARLKKLEKEREQALKYRDLKNSWIKLESSWLRPSIAIESTRFVC